MHEYLFTSESVSVGHPDKICDQISDVVLDAFLAQDPYARTGIETVVTTNRVILAGEYRGPQSVSDDLERLVRQKVRDIGYAQDGFHWQKLRFENFLHAQSADIAMGVDASQEKDEGAGDQGIMFGFACNETETLMPAAIFFAHRILENLNNARTTHYSEILGPDAKAQVTLVYENGIPVRAHTIVVSTQHAEHAERMQIEEIVMPIIEVSLPEGWIDGNTIIYLNPTGRFVIGGPDGDAGLTGRKIIVDTYGGAAPHGGGAFSGKDPTKVDRSGAYMARYAAKNVVAAGLAERCTLQVSYAIGISKPLSLYVDLHGTGNVSTDRLVRVLLRELDWSPRGMRTHLKLNRPIYSPTAAYGHFGRTPEEDGAFSWEKLDLVPILKGLS